MKTPELLAPAGNLKNLRYAIAYGADAVYAGMPRYSLRVRNNDFDSLEQLKKLSEKFRIIDEDIYFDYSKNMCCPTTPR